MDTTCSDHTNRHAVLILSGVQSPGRPTDLRHRKRSDRHRAQRPGRLPSFSRQCLQQKPTKAPTPKTQRNARKDVAAEEDETEKVFLPTGQNITQKKKKKRGVSKVRKSLHSLRNERK